MLYNKRHNLCALNQTLTNTGSEFINKRKAGYVLSSIEYAVEASSLYRDLSKPYSELNPMSVPDINLMEGLSMVANSNLKLAEINKKSGFNDFIKDIEKNQWDTSSPNTFPLFVLISVLPKVITQSLSNRIDEQTGCATFDHWTMYAKNVKRVIRASLKPHEIAKIDLELINTETIIPSFRHFTDVSSICAMIEQYSKILGCSWSLVKMSSERQLLHLKQQKDESLTQYSLRARSLARLVVGLETSFRDENIEPHCHRSWTDAFVRGLSNQKLRAATQTHYNQDNNKASTSTMYLFNLMINDVCVRESKLKDLEINLKLQRQLLGVGQAGKSQQPSDSKDTDSLELNRRRYQLNQKSDWSNQRRGPQKDTILQLNDLTRSPSDVDSKKLQNHVSSKGSGSRPAQKVTSFKASQSFSCSFCGNEKKNVRKHHTQDCPLLEKKIVAKWWDKMKVYRNAEMSGQLKQARLFSNKSFTRGNGREKYQQPRPPSDSNDRREKSKSNVKSSSLDKPKGDSSSSKNYGKSRHIPRQKFDDTNQNPRSNGDTHDEPVTERNDDDATSNQEQEQDDDPLQTTDSTQDDERSDIDACMVRDQPQEELDQIETNTPSETSDDDEFYGGTAHHIESAFSSESSDSDCNPVLNIWDGEFKVVEPMIDEKMKKKKCNGNEFVPKTASGMDEGAKTTTTM